MSRKKIDKVVVDDSKLFDFVEDKPILFPKEDKDLIMSLFKIAALSPGQADQVVSMYRKYVNPNQPVQMNGCGNCQSLFQKVYENLREWMSRNYSKFEE